MDIAIAKQILTQAVKVRTDELAVLVMANEIIGNTFKAEFISLETAQKEANDKTVEINNLTTRAETAEDKVTELTAENITLKEAAKPTEALQETPTETLSDVKPIE